MSGRHLGQHVIIWKCLSLHHKSHRCCVHLSGLIGFVGSSDVCSWSLLLISTGPLSFFIFHSYRKGSPFMAWQLRGGTMTSSLHFSLCLGLRVWWQHWWCTIATKMKGMWGKVGHVRSKFVIEVCLGTFTSVGENCEAVIPIIENNFTCWALNWNDPEFSLFVSVKRLSVSEILLLSLPWSSLDRFKLFALRVGCKVEPDQISKVLCVYFLCNILNWTLP